MNTTPNTNIQPRTEPLSAVPSQAIFQAVRDLAAVERDPRYTVDMDEWHYAEDPTNPCSVCMAGAILAHYVNNPQHYTTPSKVFTEDRAQHKRVVAFDSLRLGHIAHFLLSFPEAVKGTQANNIESAFYAHLKGIGVLDQYGDWLPQYDEDPTLFKAMLLLLAYYLESKGH